MVVGGGWWGCSNASVPGFGDECLGCQKTKLTANHMSASTHTPAESPKALETEQG